MWEWDSLECHWFLFLRELHIWFVRTVNIRCYAAMRLQTLCWLEVGGRLHRVWLVGQTRPFGMRFLIFLQQSIQCLAYCPRLGLPSLRTCPEDPFRKSSKLWPIRCWLGCIYMCCFGSMVKIGFSTVRVSWTNILSQLWCLCKVLWRGDWLVEAFFSCLSKCYRFMLWWTGL